MVLVQPRAARACSVYPERHAFHGHLDLTTAIDEMPHTEVGLCHVSRLRHNMRPCMSWEVHLEAGSALCIPQGWVYQVEVTLSLAWHHLSGKSMSHGGTLAKRGAH